jgi:hypothetical protein
MTNEYTEVSEAKRMLLAAIKQERGDMLDWANSEGIRIVHVFNPELPKGGLTVAFRKCMPDQVSTNMVECAVATCSRMDSFDRKCGTHYALCKFGNGETISLPLSSGYEQEDLSFIVKRAFTAFYFSLT